MNIVKGFVNVQSLISNLPNVTSNIGELSPIGFTYSKDKGYYTNTALDGYELITFTSVDANDNKRVLPVEEVDFIIRVVDFIKLYTSARQAPFSVDDLRSNLLDQFIAKLTDLELGEFVLNEQTGLPSWISWTNTDPNTKVYIWLSDEAFRNQYDDYEITVIPPIQNLDTFFLSTSTVANAIYAETVDKIMDRVNDAKNGYPETFIRFLRYDFIDPVHRDRRIETLWAVLIYGGYGDNIDDIKDAIAEYVLANSTHIRDNWEQIMPDIFRRTEFTILPRWDLYSIPNMLTYQGLYSQVVNPKEVLELAKTYMNMYTQTHIGNNVYIVPYPYKSIMLVIVNGQYNIEGKTDFKQLFPDFIPIPSTSLDFGRMTLKTQDLVYKLEEMLMVAETMGNYTLIPRTMRRIRRLGKLYLTRMIDNVNYVMVPKIALQG